MSIMPEPKPLSIDVEGIIFDGDSLSALAIVVWASSAGQKARWSNDELWLQDPNDTDSTLVEPGWIVINGGHGCVWLHCIPTSSYLLTSVKEV